MYWKEGGWHDYAPKGMPDFDQKQDQWDNPPGQGWAGTTAGRWRRRNSLWWFDSKFEPNPDSAADDQRRLPAGAGAGRRPVGRPRARATCSTSSNTLAGLMGTYPANGTNVNNLAIGDCQTTSPTRWGRPVHGDFPARGQAPVRLGGKRGAPQSEDVILLLGFWQAIATPRHVLGARRRPLRDGGRRRLARTS